MSKSKFWDTIQAIGFSIWAKDAKPDEIAEALKEKEEKGAEDCQSKDCKDCAAKDAEIASLKEKLEEKKEGKAEDALDALEEELKEGKKEKEEKEVKDEGAEVPVLSPEEKPTDPLPASDSGIALAMLKAMKPIVCSIKDAKERKVATDALVASVRDFMKAPVTQRASYGDLLHPKKPEQQQAAMDADTLADTYKKEIDAARARKRGLKVIEGGK